MKTSIPVAEYRNTIDNIDRAILGLTAKINATTYELLLLVREFDERGGWLRHGFANCSEWLAYRCDLGTGAAREKVRVAHALKDLPGISAAFETGALSYSKVRALTRVATAFNETSLIEFARTTTVLKVEERCRQLRNVLPDATEAANRAFNGRSLSMRRNQERGTVIITVELPIEDGELVDQALAKAMEKQGPNNPELAADSFRAQQADALVDIARQSLHGHSNGNTNGRSSSADAYQVVVHVDQSALQKGEGRSDLPVETVKRLCCDGSVISMLENADGEPLTVGRKQRTIPTAISRALQSRDGGCRFPGCNHTRFVDAHHVMHWANGGETSVGNLIQLCPRHHRMVHEGGYSICKDHNGNWYFRRRDGRAIPGCGYQLDDMLDDGIGDARLEQLARTVAVGWSAHRSSGASGGG